MSKKNIFDDVLPEEVKQLEEGKYTGKITRIERDTETFDYTRYFIKLDTEDFELQTSFPTKLTFMNTGEPSSSHAKFITRLGADLQEESFSKFTERLIGLKVSFVIVNKVTDKGTFSEIVKDSIKLI